MSQDHPLLQYSVMTDPMPLQQGKSNGKIIILASNPGIYSDQPATNYVEPTAIVFVVAMLAGMVAFQLMDRAGSRLPTTNPGR